MILYIHQYLCFFGVQYVIQAEITKKSFFNFFLMTSVNLAVTILIMALVVSMHHIFDQALMLKHIILVIFKSCFDN